MGCILWVHSITFWMITLVFTYGGVGSIEKYHCHKG